MANNYLQFSEALENVTLEEIQWFDAVKALPLGDITSEDEQFACELGLEGPRIYELEEAFDTTTIANKLHIYSTEFGDPDIVGKVMVSFLEKFRPNETFAMTWAETSSALRPGEFGGGVLVADARGYDMMDTATLVKCSPRLLGGLHDLIQAGSHND